jgi:hypothetical protein
MNFEIQYWVGPSCFLSHFRGKYSLPLTKRKKSVWIFWKARIEGCPFSNMQNNAFP